MTKILCITEAFEKLVDTYTVTLNKSNCIDIDSGS